MIYTVTANPSVDYYMELDDIRLGSMNRARSVRIYPGGKGINVTVMLRRLRIDSTALGLLCGHEGSYIRALLHEYGAPEEMVDFGGTDGQRSRINVKLCAQVETECNAPGPAVPQSALDALAARVGRMSASDELVVGGALPNGAPTDYYARLLREANRHGMPTVLDCTGQSFHAALAERPWLVKPNRIELAELAGHALDSLEAVCAAARTLQLKGAREVLVSLGGKGALLLTKAGEIWHGNPPPGHLRSTVGAGDSMVAGFLAGWRHAGESLTALRAAIAAGSATAFSEWLAEPALVKRCWDAMPMLTQLA